MGQALAGTSEDENRYSYLVLFGFDVPSQSGLIATLEFGLDVEFERSSLSSLNSPHGAYENLYRGSGLGTYAS